jgi:flagellar hook protein FlgE
MIPPTPSTSVKLAGNITATTTATMTLGTTVYDSAGVAHTLTIVLTSNTPPAFDVTVSDAADPLNITAAGTVNFDATGAYDAGTSTDPVITLADGTTTITVSLAGITQYGGPKSIAVTSADGAASGNLQQFQIGNDGSVLGVFSNGQKKTIAKVALANFNNPPGLEKIGNSTYRSTFNSGLAQVGTPGSGGRGVLLGGSLEMSNVDLAQEFTNLIIAQRGFQANSRVITTTDQMLQDLVDLKR